MRCDVVLLSDFRFRGGTSSGIAREIATLHGAGYNTQLIQVASPLLKRNWPIHPSIQTCIDQGFAQWADRKTPVEAGLALFHNPYVFTRRPAGVPRLRAEQKILIAQQPLTDTSGMPYYDPARVHEICEDMAGPGIIWAPISPTCRRNIVESGQDLSLLDDDWRHIVFVDQWACDRTQPVGEKPVIGRHSRPELEKWPASRSDLLAAYPDNPSVEVRMLGVSDDLHRLFGPFPENWTTYEFNRLDPAEFLRSIDFWVYFHHPAWVEAFGTAIAEAAASGAVVILPEHFRETFGESALYREPGQVLDTVRRYYGDWDLYRLQSQLGQRHIRSEFGPEIYLARIGRLIGPPARTGQSVLAATADDANAAPTGGTTTLPAVVERFDIAILGDFRIADDLALRIANEVRIQAAAGRRTALLHIPSKNTTGYVNAEIDACVTEGLASAIDPRSPQLQARLLVVHGPHSVFADLPDRLPRLKVDRVAVIADRLPGASYDVIQKDRLLRLLIDAPVRWAATTEEIRSGLLQLAPTLEIEAEPWVPAIADKGWRERGPASLRPVVGTIAHGTAADWPTDSAIASSLYSRDGSLQLRIFGLPAIADCPPAIDASRFDLFNAGELAFGKFVRSLDFFACFPKSPLKDAPDTAIATAMVAGVPTILPYELRPRFGAAATYAKADQAGTPIRALHAAPDEYDDLRRTAARLARQKFGPLVHAQRIARLLGERGPKSLAAAPDSGCRRVLFLSSNGVGLGHLTRLLAVARRLPPDIEPVFATMSQALSVVEAFGFHAEYLPFHVYAECDVEDWNRWLRRQLTQLIEQYDVSGIVFDGSNPYFGLIEAVAPRPDVFLMWIRRGMWRAQQVNQPIIERQRFFDLIVEPSDVADAHDEGITALHRDRVVRTDPIRLLDPEDLLDRTAAATELGIDPTRPAALIQLGAGSNRDIMLMTDAILTACRRHPELQIVLAEWAITTRPMDLWPEVRRLRGYPMSRYYQAFDFTISAAGYNSFNEILSFGLPAIFVANESPTMDDQGGRARYAEEQGAGFAISETDLDGLAAAIDMMMQPAARTLLRANCLRLSQPNGATAAAALVTQMLGKEKAHEGIHAEPASRDAAAGSAAGAAASAHIGARAAAAGNGGRKRAGTPSLRGLDADAAAAGRPSCAKGKARAIRRRVLADKNGQSRSVDAKAGLRKLRAQGNDDAGHWDFDLRVRPAGARSHRRNGGKPADKEP